MIRHAGLSGRISPHFSRFIEFFAGPAHADMTTDGNNTALWLAPGVEADLVLLFRISAGVGEAALVDGAGAANPKSIIEHRRAYSVNMLRVGDNVPLQDV